MRPPGSERRRCARRAPRRACPSPAFARARARLRSRAGEEQGVVLVLVAMLMVVFLAMAAMAVDLGSFYQAQQQAQSAADAGALAGAQDLPVQTSASTDASNFANQNASGLNNVSVTPTFPSGTQVKVTVTASTPAFFGQFLGLTSARVSASATAASTGTSTPDAAFFAMDQNCSDAGVSITNLSSANINGKVTTNATLTIQNIGRVSLGATTYGASCPPNVTPYGTSFPSGRAPHTPAYTTFPDDFSTNYSSICPSPVSSAPFSWTNMPSVVLNGTYCTTGSITISNDSSVSGTATLVGGSISISNISSMNVTPKYHNLLLYQTGPSPLQISNLSSISATIFAPNAAVTLSNLSSATSSGYIEARDISINNMSSFNYTGTGPSPSSSGNSVSLVQ